MGYFPFYIDISNILCLVVGGGKVASRKIKTLLDFDAKVVVIAPKICKEIYEFERTYNTKNKRVYIRNRKFSDEDIVDAEVIIAATDDNALNSHISNICRKSNKMINVVDVKEECSFIFPSIEKKGELVISISTGGNSPALAAKVRRDIKRFIPEYYGDLVELLGEQRENIKKEISTPEIRKQVYNEFIDCAKLYNRNLTIEEVQSIIDKYRT